MNKRYLKHVWSKLKPVHTWYFFVAFIVFLSIGIYSVRQNNLKSIQLRETLLEVDKQNGDVEGALNNLREHIYSHMNAGLSSGTLQQPVQLIYTYERLVEAKNKTVAEQNSALYTKAQEYCEQRFPAGFSGSGRIPCVQQYITDNGGQSADSVPDDLYKFDFVSPAWTPDLAGWSLLIAGVFLALFLIRFLMERWYRKELREHL